MIHGRNFFYLSVKKNQITYDSIPKLRYVKEMITQRVVVYWIMFIL